MNLAKRSAEQSEVGQLLSCLQVTYLSSCAGVSVSGVEADDGFQCVLFADCAYMQPEENHTVYSEWRSLFETHSLSLLSLLFSQLESPTNSTPSTSSTPARRQQRMTSSPVRPPTASSCRACSATECATATVVRTKTRACVPPSDPAQEVRQKCIHQCI